MILCVHVHVWSVFDLGSGEELNVAKKKKFQGRRASWTDDSLSELMAVSGLRIRPWELGKTPPSQVNTLYTNTK